MSASSRRCFIPTRHEEVHEEVRLSWPCALLVFVLCFTDTVLGCTKVQEFLSVLKLCVISGLDLLRTLGTGKNGPGILEIGYKWIKYDKADTSNFKLLTVHGFPSPS